MLNPHLSTLLAQLKLHGFTQSLDSNIDAVYSGEINFEEAMIDAVYSGEINFEEAMIDACKTELLTRARKLTEPLIRNAHLRYPHACIDEIKFDIERRGLSKQFVNRFSECTWINLHKNMSIQGPTGVGKTWLACAFATEACKKGYKTIFYRASEFFEALEQAIDQSNEKLFIKKLIRYDLLIIDDFGLSNIPPKIESHLLDEPYRVCRRLFYLS
ncbi:ATP-binding protein [Acinetobacter pittii]|uniref:ATP-binding protein n=1 Tax=Acinetobacter pittii TaxID=48296 RepID=UPI0021CD36F0|nr:ATP-binding protein [Acinetobacter pittii]